MPLSMRLSTREDEIKPELVGYELVNQPNAPKWVPVHVLADNWNLAKVYNHKIIRIEFLNQRESVYDLTVEGTHNFALAAGVFVHNSIDGDSAAAMRYTEARLSKMAEEILADIDKDTVDFLPNYDNSTEEPTVLPSRVPNLLVNGTAGIAVGMATNIPPHNLQEVAKAIVAQIDNPAISLKELMDLIPGPDFPTGGLICGRKGILEAYASGKGKMIVRAKANVEEAKERKKIIVTELPYQVNKALLIEAIADLVKERRIEGIADLRDESDRKGMRVVIELKKGADEQVVLNQLYAQTQLQTTFGVTLLAIVGGEPKILTLQDLITHFVNHRRIIVTRRTQFDLTKAEERMHLVEGLTLALQQIDSVIALIKAAKDPDLARLQLQQRFGLSEKQAAAILEMRLQRLTSLEQDKLRTERKDLATTIASLKDLLSSDQKILQVIREELLALIGAFRDARRTQILDAEEEVEAEDLIQEEDVVVTLTYEGYVKKLPLETYRQQRRGGKGVLGTATREEDMVEHIFTTSNHHHILCFSTRGKVYWLKAYQIPTGSRQSKGKAIANLLHLEDGEKVRTMLPIPVFDDHQYLLMATKKGLLKKTLLSAYSNPRKGGILALKLKPDDELITVRLTPGILDMILATRNGYAIRFNEQDIKPVGRNASGVRGIRLRKEDGVVGMEVALDSASLFTITEHGYGKRTSSTEYHGIRRGGKGVINIQTLERNGKVVGIKTVKEGDELILMTAQGIVLRVAATDISCIGRNTQGVRIMKLNDQDTVTAVARVVQSGE